MRVLYHIVPIAAMRPVRISPLGALGGGLRPQSASAIKTRTKFPRKIFASSLQYGVEAQLALCLTEVVLDSKIGGAWCFFRTSGENYGIICTDNLRIFAFNASIGTSETWKVQMCVPSEVEDASIGRISIP